MLYMVEMDMPHEESLPAFHEWYEGHLKKLVLIPGIHTAQRFHATAPTASPYLAIYNVVGPEVFTSEPYQRKAGPKSTGDWRPLLTNWHRNVVDGLRELPEIAPNGDLVVWDRLTDHAPELPGGYVSVRSVALDRTFVERGIRWSGETPKPLETDNLCVRVFKPISRRFDGTHAASG